MTPKLPAGSKFEVPVAALHREDRAACERKNSNNLKYQYGASQAPKSSTCLNIFPQDQSEQGTDRFSRSKKGSALRRVQAGTLRLEETSQPHRVPPEVEASILESETKSARDRVLVEQ